MTDTKDRALKLKVGDLVCVKQVTQDPKLPRNRMGVIVENAADSRNRPESHTQFWRICTTDGHILKFHEMFLEKVGNENEITQD